VISIDGSAGISAGTFASGTGGSVSIETRDLRLTQLGYIDLSSSAAGAAGNLDIRATDSITVSGSDGTYGSGISVGTSGSGAGGTMSLQAPRIVVDDGAAISSITRGAGRGGSILITAGDLEVRGGAAINASSVGSGGGGNLIVNASGRVLVEGGGYGYVSGLAAQSVAGGAGGQIDVTAPRIEVRDGALITAEGFGAGSAGSIRLAAGDRLVVASGGAIATQTERSDGGNIAIEGHGVVHLTDGSITTSVQGGAGDGGNIAITGAEHVVLNHSAIQANAYGGHGGNIRIDSSYFIASPGSVVEASSQLGVSGTITVTAPAVDIGAGLGVLPSNFFDATRLLREACASRAGESENSFVAVGRGRLPESAWTALASPRGGKGSDATASAAAPWRLAVSPCAGNPR
jgi:large exoprotein involved in heme utilization and adhesion